MCERKKNNSPKRETKHDNKKQNCLTKELEFKQTKNSKKHLDQDKKKQIKENMQSSQK